jgi:uncharacterized protein
MPDKELVKILSIDGGGIRGIIPAMVLAEIESQTERPACELFDLIAGTSTGGIIALGVTVPGEERPGERPGEKRCPRWSAQNLADMYVNEGPKIFDRSCVRKIVTVDGLVAEKYAATGLEAALERYMGEARLQQALADVLITSYDIQTHNPFFFKSFQPSTRPAPSLRDSAVRPAISSVLPQPLPDYPVRVVARATSAAPTYFEPAHVEVAAPSTGGSSPGAALVDGGTFANNPAMCAYAEALRNHPGADVLIVSLGTGRLTESISFDRAKHWGLVQWARPLLGVMMDGASAAIDYQLDELLGHDKDHFRFQTLLEKASDSLDDARPSNIANLAECARAMIKRDAAKLAKVCARLTGP